MSGNEIIDLLLSVDAIKIYIIIICVVFILFAVSISFSSATSTTIVAGFRKDMYEAGLVSKKQMKKAEKVERKRLKKLNKIMVNPSLTKQPEIIVPNAESPEIEKKTSGVSNEENTIPLDLKNKDEGTVVGRFPTLSHIDCEHPAYERVRECGLSL
ncbi:MAG: hypothetical protein WCR67_04555, partial [Bacilli bacterium]